MRIYLWFLPSLLVSVPVFAEGIATDGSVGAVQNFVGTAVTIPQELGKTVGNNLFHSFADFNINTGQIVTFTGSDSLQNVISRVNGNNPSIIDGILKSDIKNADFYFINPNGITFNANAQVDVPAAFHVSTADKMDFGKNGGVFYADLSKHSQLSSESPSAFGFLGNSTIGNGLVDIDNAHLQLKDGKIFDVVSGTINIKNEGDSDGTPNIDVARGQIHLAALKGAGLIDLHNHYENSASLSTKDGGDINIDSAYIDTTGDGAGRISIYGGDLSMTHSKVQANNNGNMQAVDSKGIEMNVKNLNATNSIISADTNGGGNAGNINIKVANITLNESASISADSNGDGKGGQVFIHDSDKILVQNGSRISSISNAAGSGGNVSIVGKEVSVDGGGLDKFTGFGTYAKSNGQAGKVDIKAASLNIQAGAEINSSTFGNGDANSVNVTTDKLIIDGKNNPFGLTGIYSAAGLDSSGQAGNVVVTANSIDLIDGGAISSATSNTGNAGNVEVNTKTLYIDGKNTPTGINSDSNSSATGNAGLVKVNAFDLTINTAGNIGSNSFGSGNGGAVEVKANSVLINGAGSDDSAFTGISANTFGSGDAGNVKIESNLISLIDLGRIASNTTDDGNAGKVDIMANQIFINGNNNVVYTGIASNTYWGKGNAGTVKVKSSQLNIENAGRIVSNTRGSGRAGNISIESDDININGKNSEYSSGITSAASPESTGQVGKIDIIATNKLILLNGAEVTIQNRGYASHPENIVPGTITINSPLIDIEHNSGIFSNSMQNVDAGEIFIKNFNYLTLRDGGTITAASVEGNGGDVTILGIKGVLSLKDSSITTTATGEFSNGGNIDINSDIMIMNTVLLSAHAFGDGAGGNIRLNLQSLIPSRNNLVGSPQFDLIQMGSPQFDWKPYSGLNILSASGTIKSNVPQLNLSGVLANITNTSMDNSLISQDYCALGQGSSLSKKGKGALPMRPKDFQSF
jgi:filamentous hemagglutinin family protein